MHVRGADAAERPPPTGLGAGQVAAHVDVLLHHIHRVVRTQPAAAKQDGAPSALDAETSQ